MKKRPRKAHRRKGELDRGSARPDRSEDRSEARSKDRSGARREDRRRPGFSREVAVLYEDDAVVVLNKRAGLLAVPIKGSDTPSALTLLVANLRPMRQRALIVHRIDRFASGILL